MRMVGTYRHDYTVAWVYEIIWVIWDINSYAHVQANWILVYFKIVSRSIEMLIKHTYYIGCDHNVTNIIVNIEFQNVLYFSIYLHISRYER